MPGATIADLLTLLTRDPGRPRVTWYGDDGERVELSGAVLDNWVSKTTNLLVEEFDAGPGTRLLLDLPEHWRTAVWALAAWRAGATVVTPAAGEDADVVVTAAPADHPGARELVAVTLPALARSFTGTLPPGAVDAAAAVMTYGDRIGYVPPTDPAAPALVEDGSVPHRALVPDAGAVADRSRVLRVARPVADRAALHALLEVLVADGSLVLVSPQTASALRADPARADRLVESERVTDATALG